MPPTVPIHACTPVYANAPLSAGRGRPGDRLKLERYESRLRVMAYIGYFDEIVMAAQPQVDAVVECSVSLAQSDPFKKVLEIILAFGNYMNSAKRGAAYGFKLETFNRLMDTRSADDRKVTLFHWIVQVRNRLCIKGDR